VLTEVPRLAPLLTPNEGWPCTCLLVADLGTGIRSCAINRLDHCSSDNGSGSLARGETWCTSRS
jgi:hypothetical protein